MTKQSRRVIWIVGGILVGAVALMVWPALRPFFRGGVQAAAELLARTGPWGPLVVIGLQLLQAVISPLPSWPVTVAAGALYGSVTGTLLSLLGGMLGATVNFWLARRIGQELVRRSLGERWIERAAHLGPLHYLVLSLFGRLIPIASFDVVSYLAGIGRISLPLFLGVALLGQAPAFFAYAYFGSDLAAAGEAGLWGSALMLLFVGLIAGGQRLWRRLTE
ncbi:MAG: TVP38/TMEM64 family protein [Bacillota bacterium]